MKDHLSSYSDQTHHKQPQVQVYLRSTNKSAIKIFIPTPIELSILTGIIQTQTTIPKQHLIFFYQGKAYLGQQGQDLCDTILHIKSKTIMHIRDARKMKEGNITILIQIIDSSNNKGQAKLYSVNSSANIGNFLSRISSSSVNQEFLFLWESGRKLKLSTSFYEQSIEHESTIYLVFKNQELSEEIKLKDLEILKPNNYDFELDSPVPNFKKKNKSICMIPDLTMSSQVLKWELDHHENLSTNKLATSLKWKKVQKQAKDKQMKKKLTASGKSRLKEEFQKLFQFDSIGIRQNEQEEEEPCLNVFEEDDIENTEEIIFIDSEEKENQNHQKFHGLSSKEDI